MERRRGHCLALWLNVSKASTLEHCAPSKESDGRTTSLMKNSASEQASPQYFVCWLKGAYAGSATYCGYPNPTNTLVDGLRPCCSWLEATAWRASYSLARRY